MINLKKKLNQGALLLIAILTTIEEEVTKIEKEAGTEIERGIIGIRDTEKRAEADLLIIVIDIQGSIINKF